MMPGLRRRPSQIPILALLMAALLAAGSGALPTVASAAVPGQALARPLADNDLRFDRLSAEDGLSHNTVNAILQDDQGFLWLGTDDGLNKYDGYGFTIYRHSADDPTSLSDNTVLALYQDRDGAIWVGTQTALHRFDRENNGFVRYPSASVLSLFEDRLGTFWVGTTDVLFTFDRASASFARIRPVVVRAICEDRAGTLWFGTEGAGLDWLEAGTLPGRYQIGAFGHYDAQTPGVLSSNTVRAIYQDSAGALWLGTDGGLDRLDPATGQFSHYRYDASDPRGLSDPAVSAIVADAAGTLWVGTVAGGLNRLDYAAGQWAHYRHDPSDPYSLSMDSIQTIVPDRSGLLWVGTRDGGVNKLNLDRGPFRQYRHVSGEPNSLGSDTALTVLQDHNGIFWVGTNDGLDRFDPSTGSWSHFRHDPQEPGSLSNNTVTALAEDEAGTLWVGTWGGGLDRFAPRTELFLHYHFEADDPSSLSSNYLQALAPGEGNTLWIGTAGGGLSRLEVAAGRFVSYRHTYGSAGRRAPERNNVTRIVRDRTGPQLWLGTAAGLERFDPRTGQFDPISHDPSDPAGPGPEEVLAVLQDSSGTLWVAVQGHGLDRLDPQTGTLVHYRERDSLATDTVYGILEDAQGALWLRTSQGVSRLDPQSGAVRNYDRADGLGSTGLPMAAFYLSAEGEIWVGGLNGVVTFYPGQMAENRHIPPIVITQFGRFNQVVRQNMAAGERIVLSHQDNFISFDFAALDYRSPGKNRYAYMLEGLDPTWVEAGTRRHADYPNLPPGNYTFRVKGSNDDGIWNEQGAAVRITVTPPFWARWWFIGSVVLVLATGAFGVYRGRVRNIVVRSRELERLVSERTAEIERRRQELESLYRADEELSRYLRLDQVLQTLVDTAVDLLHADKGSLLMWDERHERLTLRFNHGFSPETAARVSLAPGEGSAGRVALSGEPAIVADTATDPRTTRRITEPEGIRSIMQVPITAGGEILGVFSADSLRPGAFGEADLHLLLTLAQRAARAIENAQRYERVQETVAAEERSRLARELHDAVTQTLFSASLIADVLPKVWAEDPEKGRQQLEEVRLLTRGALAEMRTLLLELRPESLTEAKMEDLLGQLVRALAGRTGCPVNLTLGGSTTLPGSVQVAFYRIAQEAMNNIARHAEAAQVEVHYGSVPGQAQLSICDDGRGFEADQVVRDHFGLQNMRERAAAIGARIEIASQPGAGTRIALEWQEEHGDVRNKPDPCPDR